MKREPFTELYQHYVPEPPAEKEQLPKKWPEELC
jgi:hypothetical protein